VQELNAALVGTKSRHDNISSRSAKGDTETSATVEALQSDLEIANAHLALERERVRSGTC
jgi:hypothetical protein